MHHGHVGGVAAQGMMPQTQVAMEKAAALARAASVRRRLLREAAEVGAGLDGDAEELVTAWKGTSGGGKRAISYWV